MSNNRVIKINPATFKGTYNLDIFCTSFIKDADLFPKGMSRDELNARAIEFIIQANIPYCSPYAISARDMNTRRFEYKDKFIEYSPSPMGLPTIRDADVLVYCVTWIANAAFDGRNEDVGSTYEFDVNDFYEFAGRPRNGERENQLVQGLQRLAGSRITTNTRPLGLDNRSFHYIEKVELKQDRDGRLKSVIVQLPHTIYCLAQNEFIDPIHPDYFAQSNVRRHIYLFLKQYCGNKKKMPVSFAKLRDVAGFTSPLRKFLPIIDELTTKPLPEFASYRSENIATESESMSFLCVG